MRGLFAVAVGLSFAFVSACGNDTQTGTLTLRARLPDHVQVVEKAPSFQKAAYNNAGGIDTVRVAVWQDARLKLSKDFAATSRAGEVVELGAGVYDVVVEGLAAGQPVVRGRKAGIRVDSGKIADAGEFLLAPINPAPPALEASPAAVTNVATLTLTVTKEMFTGIALGGELLSPPDDAKTATLEIRLAEGLNRISIAAVNPEGVAGDAVNLQIELDTKAPEIKSFQVAGGRLAVTESTIAWSAVVDGATEMHVWESATAAQVGLAPATSISPWTPYRAQGTLTLSAGPGLKTVTARFRDKAGNIAQTKATITLLAPVAMTALAPSSGVAGTSVNLTGRGFGSVQGRGKVWIAGTAANPTTWSEASITFAVPAGLGAGPRAVTVSTDTATSNAATFTILPRIDGRSVTEQKPGFTVQVTGVDFGAAKGSAWIGGVAATPAFWNDGTINITVPSDSYPGPQTMSVVTATGYASPATSLSVMPTFNNNTSVAPKGGTITINGGALGDGGTVTIGGVEAPVAGWSNRVVAVTMPTGIAAGSHPLILYSAGYTVTANVTLRPTIASKAVSEAIAGGTVTLFGDMFGVTQGSSHIDFGGVRVDSVISWSDTQIEFSIPATATANGISVIVSVNGASSNNTIIFVYPSIGTINPPTVRAGDTVDVTGGNFGDTQGASLLTVGGLGLAAATWSQTHLSFAVPAELPAGAASLQVKVNGYASAASPFTVTPYLYGSTPTRATAGSVVTATGSGFGIDPLAVSVWVGGAGATVNSVTHTTISFTIPAAAAAGYVTTSVSVNGHVASGWFIVLPYIASLSPTSGTTSTSVTISGTHFGDIQGSGGVWVGGPTPATVLSWSDTSVTVEMPVTQPGPQDVVLKAGTFDAGYDSNPVAFTVKPRIDYISPSTPASPGDLMTILGTAFSDFAAGNTLFVGPATAIVSSWSNTNLSASVPSVPAGIHNVTLVANGVSSDPVTFTVKPLLAGIAPTSGYAGTRVTLSGNGFGAAQGASTVSLGGLLLTPASWSETLIEVDLPSFVPAGTDNFKVTVNDIESETWAFTVSPFIASVSPEVLEPGADFTLTGTSFGDTQQGSTITFGASPVTPSSWSSTAVAGAAPSLPDGVYTITITVNGEISNPVTATVFLPISAPTDLKVADVWYNAIDLWWAIDLTWKDNSVDETGYDIERKAVDVPGFTFLASVGAGVTTYTDSGVPDNVAYVYRVVARRNAVFSDFSNEAEAGTHRAETVELGSSHACMGRTDGALMCWGYNLSRQLGLGDGVDRRLPTHVTGFATSVSMVAAGGSHTCAADTAGDVYCWGTSGSGQVGDGTITIRSTPTPVTALANVVGLSSYASHTCAWQAAGSPACWGSGTSGQIGDGSMENRLYPTAVSGIAGPVSTVATGTMHSCALLADGTVSCWGSNSFGQLGTGDNLPSPTPVTVVGLAGAVDLKAAYGHTCALMGNATVKCWGWNGAGQLGNGGTANSYVPVSVAGLAQVTQVAAGYVHTCALLATGTVTCWGQGKFGEMGNGAGERALTPVPVSEVTGAVGIAADDIGTCAVLASGGIRCWGGNSKGRFGDGSADYRDVPVLVSGLETGVSSVANGNETSCAVHAGAAKCWGNNTGGSVGDGTVGNARPAPTQVAGAASSVADVAVGTYHSCYLSTAGTVHCWGENYNGELGDGSVTPRTTPGAATLITSATLLRAASANTCAIEGGALYCWGDNAFSQLGDGGTTDRNVPFVVPGLSSDVVDVTLGQSYMCARLVTGEVRCWGKNTNGQIGIGVAGGNVTAPTTVALGAPAVSVCARNDHACAVLDDGTVKCWGDGTFGKLGNGGTLQQTLPVLVAGVTDAAMVACTSNSTCVLTTGGAVKCWGSATRGVLGIGTTTSTHYLSPQMVPSLSTVTSLRSGWEDYCVTTAEGAAYCWGYNNYNQTGDVYNTYTPKSVLRLVP